MTYTDFERAKSGLLSQLVLLDSICNEVVANSKPHVAEVRLEQWRNQTDEILLMLGKKETLADISKKVAVEISAPTNRILEEKKKYRAFVLRVIKEYEDALTQMSDEGECSFPCTD